MLRSGRMKLLTPARQRIDSCRLKSIRCGWLTSALV